VPGAETESDNLIVCKVINAFDNPTLRWNADGGTSYNVRRQGSVISVWVEMVTAPEPGAIVTSNTTLSRSRAYLIRTRIDSVTIDIPCTIELSHLAGPVTNSAGAADQGHAALPQLPSADRNEMRGPRFERSSDRLIVIIVSPTVATSFDRVPGAPPMSVQVRPPSPE